MEDKKRNLKIMLERTEELLIKENQKTVLFMTIYYIVLCGIMMYAQNGNIKDIIVEAVVLGIFISVLTIIVYVFFTSIFTKKEDLEKMILKLKIQIDRIDRKGLSDESIELMDFIDEDEDRW